MPEIGEAQALLAALAKTDGGQGRGRAATATGDNCTSPMATRCLRRAGSARRKRRKPSPEPERDGDKDAPERLAADLGLWAGSYVRGELPAMRAHAAAFLDDVEARPDSPEAGVAHRAAGIIAGSPASIARRAIIWNARSPCSSPAVTTISPFASD